MKKLKKSAVVLCAVFASMQITMAGQFDGVDVGLGKDFGGSQINHATDGLVGITGNGTGNVGLDFNSNTHINWDNLNVGRGESLNFNAVDGANNLTILNTVNKGMTNVYGSINANSGIGQLIIANPNGVLFDGASFTTAGDAMITTKDLTGVKAEDLAKFDIKNEKFSNLYNDEGKLIPIEIRNGSTFNVGGDYSIVAAGIKAANSTITAKNVKLITANGQDYLALNQKAPTKHQEVTKLTAMNINGNLYVTNEAGALSIENGGNINGNVKINTEGNVNLNKVNDGKKLTIKGDVDVKGNGARMYLRNADVDGNLKMVNGGGFLDVGDVHVTKNAEIKTTNESQNYDNNCHEPVKHFVHVIGDTKVDGNLTVESENNIHIGGYDYDAKKLADGKLTVGGDLTAHAKNGHVMTTIDTTAGNKISLKSDNLNVLTDGKATLTAKEYEFSANGYIGGLTSTDNMSVDEKVVNIMENYIHIPDTVGTPGNINIAGGTITAINTTTNANILSKGDVKLTGANAGTINITAPNKYMEITGDVHAKDINVGKETDRLKVDFAGRDYNLNYTNIRDNKVVTVKGNEEVTYELTNGKGGHNDGTQLKGENTYLVGPEGPTPPEPGPDPDPTPTPDPDDNENVKVLRSFENKSVDLNQVYTPVAYAADLDDDKIDKGVRKNVDGSVTVVKAFPMIN